MITKEYRTEKPDLWDYRINSTHAWLLGSSTDTSCMYNDMRGRTYVFSSEGYLRLC